MAQELPRSTDVTSNASDGAQRVGHILLALAIVTTSTGIGLAVFFELVTVLL